MDGATGSSPQAEWGTAASVAPHGPSPKYVADGSAAAETGTETVKVASGFFAKLKAFFRALFGKLPKIAQAYLGVQIYEQ